MVRGTHAGAGTEPRRKRHAGKLDATRGGSNGVATAHAAAQIPRVTHPALHPPYGLASVTFRYKALASSAARAPIGPARDVALAWFVCARLLDGVLGADPLSEPVRTARAGAARTWLAGIGLAAGHRLPFSRLADACGAPGAPDRPRIARAVADALKGTADLLDPQARAELEPFVKAQA